MAKIDFCFTVYDGDAISDIYHMSKPVKGSYWDLVFSIIKFGHLSIDLIKMVLDEDFETHWPILQLVMMKDDEGLFYIEWLDASLQKIKSVKR